MQKSKPVLLIIAAAILGGCSLLPQNNAATITAPTTAITATITPSPTPTPTPTITESLDSLHKQVSAIQGDAGAADLKALDTEATGL